MQAPKNGFFYVLDRVTGELLSADKYVPVTWASHVDLKTGRPVETPEANYSKETRIIVPAAFGGHNWHPMAFNPKTGLVYIPAMQPMGIYPLSEEFKGTGKFTRRDMFWNPGIDWNAYTTTISRCSSSSAARCRRIVATSRPGIRSRRRRSGRSSTRHSGTAACSRLRATCCSRAPATAASSPTPPTPAILWAVPTMVGIIAPPVTYEVDGEQYVAVMAGYGGAGAVTGGDPRTMASGRYVNDGYVLAFKLDGKAPMPRIAERNTQIPEQPRIEATAAQVENGKFTYCAPAWSATARSWSLAA